VEQGESGYAGKGESPLLLSIHPNPSQDEILIRYLLPHSNPAELSIYNIQGQLIRKLSLAIRPGESSLTYDGKDREGRPLPSGVYLLTLTTPQGTQTIPFIRLR